MVGKNEIGGLEKTMKGARDGLEARRRTLENYCSAVRFLIQPWGSFGRRQTVVVVSRVIFDAHAWVSKRFKEFARSFEVRPELHRLDVFESAAGEVNSFEEQSQFFEAHFQTNRAASLQVSDSINPLTTGTSFKACQGLLHQQVDGRSDGQAALSG